MVQFRPQAHEVIGKIVYYGPPLGGKTTNLRTLYQGYPKDSRGELTVVPTGGDRTIFFDLLPIFAGKLRGLDLRIQLYTVPGQVHYNATRQVVLRGVDGVVFVADSQRELLRANQQSWENLKENLLLQGLELAEVPHVIQYNKRDLANIVPVEELDALLNEFNAPFFESVATVGIGVEETLKAVVKLVVRSFRDRFNMALEAPVTQPVVVPPPRRSQGLDAATIAPVAATVPAEVTQRVIVAPLRTPEGVPVPSAPLPEAGASPFPSPAAEQTGEGAALEGAAPAFEAAPEAAPPVGEGPFGELPPAEAEAPFAVEEARPPTPPVPVAAAFAEVRFGEERGAPAGETVEAGVPSREAECIGQPVEELEAAESFAFAAPSPPELEPAPEAVAVPLETPPVAAVDVAAAAAEREPFPLDEAPFPELAPPEPVAGADVFAITPAPPAEPAPVERVVLGELEPRIVAALGNVRELELEIPVPAKWIGGKRMTVQLRLTLVPQQESVDE